MKSKKKIEKQKPDKQQVVKTESPEDKIESRRAFLKKWWMGLGILAGAEFLGVVTGFLFSGKGKNKETEAKKLIETGPVDSFKPNSVTPFRGGRFFLARLEDGGFIAISLRCTHLGCSINWEEDKKRFICPCHASAFNIKGDVLNPPAPKALDYYPVIIENGVVKVDVGTRRQREKFNKDQLTFAYLR
jgi:cytochrome b6-f complex iron-sulfur subunit